jgi:hypothetical protein
MFYQQPMQIIPPKLLCAFLLLEFLNVTEASNTKIRFSKLQFLVPPQMEFEKLERHSTLTFPISQNFLHIGKNISARLSSIPHQ